MNTSFLGLAVATVLTACGIETENPFITAGLASMVATVLTACGIETKRSSFIAFSIFVGCNSTYRLRY